MTVKVYTVQLKTINGQHVLNIVDQQQPITIDVPTTILWYLDDATATFNPLDAASNPGFSWVEPGQTGSSFQPPRLVAGEQVITLLDLATTPGNFVYQLCATRMDDGHPTLYKTTLTPPRGTVNDPTIKNN